MEHNAIPAGENHHPYQWIVADAVARLNLPVTAVDTHKRCLQLDDGSEWRLLGADPVAWADATTVSTDPLAYYILARS